jgi:hypothetical protein
MLTHRTLILLLLCFTLLLTGCKTQQTSINSPLIHSQSGSKDSPKWDPLTHQRMNELNLLQNRGANIDNAQAQFSRSVMRSMQQWRVNNRNFNR